MRNGTYYLNNNGSRWVELVDGKREKRVFEVSDGTTVTRSVAFYESFGNFALAAISWKGKQIKVFLDTVLEVKL